MLRRGGIFVLRRAWRPLQATRYRYLASIGSGREESERSRFEGEASREDQLLSLELGSAIRRSFAEDEVDAATFYKRDGKLYGITGETADDWEPNHEDEALVSELVELFKQGNAAAWEAEDIVRTHGGILRPVHVFEVLKACTDPALGFAFFKWSALQPFFQHGTATFNMMLKLLQEGRMHKDLVEVSREMDRLEVPKSDTTYRILLSALFQGRLVEEALETFSQMERSSTPPGVGEYRRLINTMLNMEYYPVIPVLFERLLAAGCIPDAYIYNAVISSYCSMAKMDEAIQVFEKMQTKCSCDIYTYTILIDGCIKCYQVQRATDFYTDMLANGCLPGEEIFNLLFGLHARNGKIEQAVDLFRKVVETGCQPTLKSYGMLLDTFSMVDNIRGAYDFFKELISKGFYPSIVTCNSLLGKLKRAGKTSLALQFFDEMKAFPNSKPTAISYNIAIDLLGKIGKCDEAWKVFEDMKANGCAPCLITYNHLMVRLGRAGFIESCFNLFEEMKARAIYPNQYTYCALIDVLARYNQLEQALQFLDEMRNLHLEPHSTTLQILIKCLWTSGNMGAARRLCEQYPGVYTMDSETRNAELTTAEGAGTSQMQ